MTSDEQEQVWKLFFPEAARRQAKIQENGVRFVHYTSAAAGLAILRSGRMLLRNSLLMNDFSEVEYGRNCLFTAYRGPTGDRLKAIMRTIQVDLPEILESNFDAMFLDVRNETYLVAISEHGNQEFGDELEDRFGRLSMWRAYASKNGVAFVFNNRPFMTESNVLNAFTSPVTYATPDTFTCKFDELVVGLENNIALLKKHMSGSYFHDCLISAFRFATQSTKHPAFSEEREWRVIYSPTILQRGGEMTPEQLIKIPTEIMDLNGVPQRTYAIPFKDYPDEGFIGATVPDLVDRVLIGPTLDAYAIAQAYVAELTGQGVSHAHEKVVITGVPLRV